MSENPAEAPSKPPVPRGCGTAITRADLAQRFPAAQRPTEPPESPCGWCNETDEHRTDCPSWTSENPAETQQDGQPWRVGSHYGIHVYERDESQANDRPVATFHRPEDAERAVAAVNAVPQLTAALRAVLDLAEQWENLASKNEARAAQLAEEGDDPHAHYRAGRCDSYMQAAARIRAAIGGDR